MKGPHDSPQKSGKQVRERSMPPNDAAGIGAARLWGYAAPVRARNPVLEKKDLENSGGELVDSPNI